MSPEQTSGKPVDGRSDVYAFGVILFEALTGGRPFYADNFAEVAVKHLNDPVPRPSAWPTAPHAVPPELDELVASCLQKDPCDRVGSMQEDALALRRSSEAGTFEREALVALESPAEDEPRDSTLTMMTQFSRQRRIRSWIVPAAGAAMVALLALAIGVFDGDAAVVQAAAESPATAAPAKRSVMPMPRSLVEAAAAKQSGVVQLEDQAPGPTAKPAARAASPKPVRRTRAASPKRPRHRYHKDALVDPFSRPFAKEQR
jgi:serine/threonine-protein kinase